MAWLGTSDCKRSVTKTPLTTCPIVPYKLSRQTFEVTLYRCRDCGNEYTATQTPAQAAKEYDNLQWKRCNKQ